MNNNKAPLITRLVIVHTSAVRPLLTSMAAASDWVSMILNHRELCRSQHVIGREIGSMAELYEEEKYLL